MTASPPFPSIDSPGRDVMFRELYRRVCAIEQRVGISTGKANQLNLTNEFINEFTTVAQGRQVEVFLRIIQIRFVRWTGGTAATSSSPPASAQEPPTRVLSVGPIYTSSIPLLVQEFP